MSASNELVAMGVDPGYANCGIAVLWREGARWKLHAHVWVRTDPKARFEERLRLVWLALDDLARKWRPVVVGFESQLGAQEGARRRGRIDVAALQVREAVGVIRAAAWGVGADLCEVSPQAVKRALGATATATKRQVVQAAGRLFGAVLSEHEADAAGAALVGARQQGFCAATLKPSVPA